MAGEAFKIFELAAEAAYSAMYDAHPADVKEHYETARLNLFRAIESAHRGGNDGEAARLALRLAQIQQVYERRFRGVGR
jgi:hypothetical protein